MGGIEPPCYVSYNTRLLAYPRTARPVARLSELSGGRIGPRASPPDPPLALWGGKKPVYRSWMSGLSATPAVSRSGESGFGHDGLCLSNNVGSVVYVVGPFNGACPLRPARCFRLPRSRNLSSPLLWILARVSTRGIERLGVSGVVHHGRPRILSRTTDWARTGPRGSSGDRR